jgi:hypothetical protein
MAPISAVMPAPTRAATIIEASTGPSTRTMALVMTVPR